ncbi:MAG: hypothetical protein QNJ40_14090 [Xanthomonadales bacterium]|nr:hypothetical protein [Xanthomonadales bacterium]
MKPSQLLFLGLVGACVVLAGVAGLLFSGVGQGIDPLPPIERESQLAGGPLGDGDFNLPPIESYQEIKDRPLFNDDRKPVVEETVGGEDEEGGDGTGGPEPVELNVTVTGIIITPEKKLAMVTNNETKESLRLQEGMNLDGAQANWTLATIEPRKLVFEGGGEGPAEAELATFTQALKGGAPAKPRPRANTSKPSGGSAGNKTTTAGNTNKTASDQDRAARAEEIRRRVAERRAQLREEAARRRAEQEQDDDNDD